MTSSFTIIDSLKSPMDKVNENNFCWNLNNMNFNEDLWKRILIPVQIPKYSSLDQLEMESQKVLKTDVDRTRAEEMTEIEREQLEILLKFYCKEHNCPYKQGMNEILAPFILMVRYNLPLNQVYNYFEGFIDHLLPTMFLDKDFRPLKSMFMILRLLLRYHEPRISTFFHDNGIFPEIYATSWFLTAYSSKVGNLEALFLIWEELIIQNDPLHTIYLGVAILGYFKNFILANEGSLIPQTILHLPLNDANYIREIIQKAREIKNKMPFSLHIKLKSYDIFNLDKINYINEELEMQFCLNIMPHEVLMREFPDDKICSCKNNDCDWCKTKEKKVPLIIIDARTQSEHFQGVFPNSIILVPEAYDDHNIIIDFPDQFLEMRGIYHFCLLASKELKGTNFDLKDDNQDEEDDPNIVQNMVQNLFQAFLLKGFQYVSIVNGGYSRCHELAIKNNLPIEGHDKSICQLCTPNKRRISDILTDLMMGRVVRAFSDDKCKTPRMIDIDALRSDPLTSFFACKEYNIKQEKILNDSLCLIVTDISVIVGEIDEVDKEADPYIIKQLKIKNLVKIKSHKKLKNVIKLKFKGADKAFYYFMNSVSDAESCLRSLSRNYAELSMKI
ncbi:TBC1D23_3 [Blepharisma stoltei]|uniref:Rab-GAP TBC domain-containing protein n=1 Tax=Blepharisma stoltei TaxID=1481888 RepID=A0AAU9K2K5_9CILI|nr:unnamed protein product [Blepharisma stoltei]